MVFNRGYSIRPSLDASLLAVDATCEHPMVGARMMNDACRHLRGDEESSKNGWK